ncbi:hypothetical protein Tam10B_1845 [Bifidobacterium vansinderenii]|uniref:Uncharacterized protein n=1 Tax=Bifidobacterium vansinderenii TaxID=1984871 RepID=A0A229VW93_9BIFI|nr:hypothetical protein Tam10B_1845 [Bifidobacterium vansinderenii]
MREYSYNGSTFLFDADHVPAGAVEVNRPVPVETADDSEPDIPSDKPAHTRSRRVRNKAARS